MSVKVTGAGQTFLKIDGIFQLISNLYYYLKQYKFNHEKERSETLQKTCHQLSKKQIVFEMGSETGVGRVYTSHSVIHVIHLIFQAAQQQNMDSHQCLCDFLCGGTLLLSQNSLHSVQLPCLSLFLVLHVQFALAC